MISALVLQEEATFQYIKLPYLREQEMFFFNHEHGLNVAVSRYE